MPRHKAYDTLDQMQIDLASGRVDTAFGTPPLWRISSPSLKAGFQAHRRQDRQFLRSDVSAKTSASASPRRTPELKARIDKALCELVAGGLDRQGQPDLVQDRHLPALQTRPMRRLRKASGRRCRQDNRQVLGCCDGIWIMAGMEGGWIGAILRGAAITVVLGLASMVFGIVIGTPGVDWARIFPLTLVVDFYTSIVPACRNCSSSICCSSPRWSSWPVSRPPSVTRGWPAAAMPSSSPSSPSRDFRGLFDRGGARRAGGHSRRPYRGGAGARHSRQAHLPPHHRAADAAHRRARHD